jgi:hypothetical protein
LHLEPASHRSTSFTLRPSLTILIPGRGLEEVLLEPTRTWKTFQVSFYWFF